MIVFGEILWDIFENEKRIGGAPFNFGAHCAKLGLDVDVISAVGNDARGEMAILAAKNLKINTDNIQVVDYQTGHCLVSLQNGSPSYHLVENVAYDKIPLPETPALRQMPFILERLRKEVQNQKRPFKRS